MTFVISLLGFLIFLFLAITEDRDGQIICTIVSLLFVSHFIVALFVEF